MSSKIRCAVCNREYTKHYYNNKHIYTDKHRDRVRASLDTSVSTDENSNQELLNSKTTKKNTTKITCECGKIIKQFRLEKHLKSINHIERLKVRKQAEGEAAMKEIMNDIRKVRAREEKIDQLAQDVVDLAIKEAKEELEYLRDCQAEIDELFEDDEDDDMYDMTNQLTLEQNLEITERINQEGGGKLEDLKSKLKDGLKQKKRLQKLLETAKEDFDMAMDDDEETELLVEIDDLEEDINKVNALISDLKESIKKFTDKPSEKKAVAITNKLGKLVGERMDIVHEKKEIGSKRHEKINKEIDELVSKRAKLLEPKVKPKAKPKPKPIPQIFEEEIVETEGQMLTRYEAELDRVQRERNQAIVGKQKYVAIIDLQEDALEVAIAQTELSKLVLIVTAANARILTLSDVVYRLREVHRRATIEEQDQDDDDPVIDPDDIQLAEDEEVLRDMAITLKGDKIIQQLNIPAEIVDEKLEVDLENPESERFVRRVEEKKEEEEKEEPIPREISALLREEKRLSDLLAGRMPQDLRLRLKRRFTRVLTATNNYIDSLVGFMKTVMREKVSRDRAAYLQIPTVFVAAPPSTDYSYEVLSRIFLEDIGNRNLHYIDAASMTIHEMRRIQHELRTINTFYSGMNSVIKLRAHTLQAEVDEQGNITSNERINDVSNMPERNVIAMVRGRWEDVEMVEHGSDLVTTLNSNRDRTSATIQGAVVRYSLIVYTSKRDDKKQRKNKAGAFFHFFHLLPLNLEEFQMYKKSEEDDGLTKDEREKARENGTVYRYDNLCFINCLEVAGVSEDKVNTLKAMLMSRDIAFSHLKNIAKKMDIRLEVTTLGRKKDNFRKRKVNQFGSGEEIKICLYKGHFFPDKKIAITAYAMKNFKTIRHLPNWCSISDNEGHRRHQRLGQDSIRVIEWLCDNQEELLKRITFQELERTTFFSKAPLTNLKYSKDNDIAVQPSQNSYEKLACRYIKKCLVNLEKIEEDNKLREGIEKNRRIREEIANWVIRNDGKSLGETLRTMTKVPKYENVYIHKGQMYYVHTDCPLEHHKFYRPVETIGDSKEDEEREEFWKHINKSQYLHQSFKTYVPNEEELDADGAPITKKKFGWVFTNPIQSYGMDYKRAYIDTETYVDTINGNKHQVFMCCIYTEEGKMISEYGETSVPRALNQLKPGRWLLYAHNLRYDTSQIMEHLSVDDLIVKGSKILQINSHFMHKSKDISEFIFHDSYMKIPEPLRNFGNMFKLDVEKDIMAYGSYNRQNIYANDIPIIDSLKYLKVTDHEQFEKNIDKWGLRVGAKNYKHIEYARKYCELDVKVLCQGMEKFALWIFKYFGVDMHMSITLPSMANKYFTNNGAYEGCFNIGSAPRKFIQEAVIGGRVMMANNVKQCIQARIQDFDAVSLYPSAMKRIATDIGGYLKGLPRIIEEEQLNDEFLKAQDGYFIELEITKVGVNRAFSLVNYKDENGIRQFKNQECVGKRMILDKISIEDMVKFQKIEYRIIRGYYFNEGRNPKVNTLITNAFNKRLALKKQGNPAQKVFKLLMNSSYGKTIQKPILEEIKIIKDVEQYMINHYSTIISRQPIKEDSNIWMCKVNMAIDDQRMLPQVGIEILSMSKRIMNEVMCTAEDEKIDIYYQDTDSMHLKEDDVKTLQIAYNKKYKRELIGKNMGQFHSDFNGIKGSIHTRSVHLITLGKKCYVDHLEHTMPDGSKQFTNHIRMKGISTESVNLLAAQRFNNNPLELFYNLLDCTKRMEFNLLAPKQTPFVYNNRQETATTGRVRFKYRGIEVRSIPSFNRRVTFPGNEVNTQAFIY